MATHPQPRSYLSLDMAVLIRHAWMRCLRVKVKVEVKVKFTITVNVEVGVGCGAKG